MRPLAHSRSRLIVSAATVVLASLVAFVGCSTDGDSAATTATVDIAP